MPPGRPRKPIEEHQRDGTTPEGAHGKVNATLVGGRGRPDKPPGLASDREASRVWDLVVDDLVDGNVLDTADWPAVEAFSVQVGLARKMRRRRLKDGEFTEGQKGALIVAPWVQLELKAWDAATKLGDGLGLSPRGRAALGLKVKGAGRSHGQTRRGVPDGARSARGGLGVVEGGKA